MNQTVDIPSPNGHPWAPGAPRAMIGSQHPVHARRQHGALTHQTQGTGTVIAAELTNEGHTLHLTLDLPDNVGHALSGPQVTHDDRGIPVYETEGLL